MWSIGVITYALLSGCFPFFSDDSFEMRDKIVSAELSFPSDRWAGISVYAKDFIKWLLILEPKDRYTADQAYKHPWIQQSAHKSSGINLRSSLDNYMILSRSLRESDRMDRSLGASDRMLVN
eukprot:TRINITY_DN3234_c0_g1_i3.p1 TRINITY_DN3234_c0_g1~~TRINITY_DN3234_c0_g1_i3.p1  ORF type:complete len:122 (-),score=23.13 TRINITY_DN3234_c0_g1_i3:74-439(-)